MSTLTLVNLVHTLDNEILLPAGTDLSIETLETLVSSNTVSSYESVLFIDHASVKEDLLAFLNQPPYHIIFSDQTQKDELIIFMGTIQLMNPILRSMDYFRQYDFYTYRHTLVVFALSTLIATDLLSHHQDQIALAATGPTHDMGKICVPLDILKKTTPLTRKERSIMEHHSAAGYVLLSYYLKDFNSLAAKVARDHHERKNGSGYPCGIKLTDKMVEIMAVCDVYDALLSPRSYRPTSYDNRTALEEITGMAERNEIGWDVVKALVAHNRRSHVHFNEEKISLEKRGTPPPGNVYGIIEDEDDQSAS